MHDASIYETHAEFTQRKREMEWRGKGGVAYLWLRQFQKSDYKTKAISASAGEKKNPSDAIMK